MGSFGGCRVGGDRRDGFLCGLGAIARLPLQIPMITTALKVYRHS